MHSTFDDEDAIDLSDEDDNDNQGDNKDKDMSDTYTLQTVDPATLIPRLKALLPLANQGHTMKDLEPSSIPSAFEDTNLIADRVRYLHAKFARVRT